ncbi:MAG: proteasome accessory factor PafA2 family protein [Fimbriimonadaceae bacterium]|nr:proteasome accessory factor PafA2 family protein [Fimbriimonadaceae bacterium]QYK59049.1 MAG: proteasome accessory factor PafA2 family protein [Fimbriimonadaceae bacterium]
MPPRTPGERIFGIETEFGTLVADDEGSPEEVVEAIKDHVFYEQRLGCIDLHARDEVFEPAESGGFLLNGARLYIDAVGSHLEYATAECRKLKDLLANDRAGHRVIVRAIRELGLQDRVDVYNNSIDHYHGHTWGCHENYLVEMSEDFFSNKAPWLYAFLVTRQIFAGVGRVGGHILAAGGRPELHEVSQNPIDYIWVSQIYNVYEDEGIEFQLSQRADHIIKTIASRVRFNRAIINPKWEHFYSHEGMHRLHVLFGESNQSEYAFALKVGSTCLALRLVEEGLVPERLVLAEPLIALREVSRDPEFKWPVALADGTVTTAIEVQREYLRLAESYAGQGQDVDWVLTEWRTVLDRLEEDPLSLEDCLDWPRKRRLVFDYRREHGLEANHPALHTLDLEYHNIDPDKSLYYPDPCRRFLEEIDILDAMTDPPTDTRALGRSRLVAKLLSHRSPQIYAFDWSGVALGRGRYIEMSDPFETYEECAT